MKVYEALRWASSFLQEHDYEAAIGERLLQHHTGWSRTRLLAEYHTILEEELVDKFQKDVHLAAKGTPVQHITGEETFYGRTFLVSSDVLIPRPETEELIEAVLARLPLIHNSSNGIPVKIVDVGTGSGIIAVTLALELSDSIVTATDISPEALSVAKQNAKRLHAEVTFLKGDLLEPLTSIGEKGSIVISNPPYIPEGDRAVMKANVVDHEPSLALFAGEDGLNIYRRLVKQIPKFLLKPGMIALEIGHGQGEAVKKLIVEQFNGATVEILDDINGKERMVISVIYE
ncbi:peptide chain release factor N(5)-glutamine methyltransferase [Bacillus tamaricis]|uniref:Release factor glutamine methyltransferase n=2 Tax=Evansella tamaricis TaxID=2069301 RepID=A0ABS6JD45_9BACI|nr:peptide chain release factor N(5)-glutamine methyltransferase [Evansella tamaricis]